MEDYTSKYKGEQVEVALFGGEYQEGVLTAYCYVEDVAHIELNGHILVPLQNIASLHCSSRCDAPDPDWPPRGLAEEYRKVFGAFLEQYKKACAGMNIDYRLVRTDQALESFVRAYLEERRRLSR